MTINWWIAGILLFNFKLVHVPAIHHTAANRLSQRTPAPEDPPETDDFEEWIDEELLVAPNVLLHWHLCEALRLVQPD
jgi:hypothetical protein